MTPAVLVACTPTSVSPPPTLCCHCCSRSIHGQNPCVASTNQQACTPSNPAMLHLIPRKTAGPFTTPTGGKSGAPAAGALNQPDPVAARIVTLYINPQQWVCLQGRMPQALSARAHQSCCASSSRRTQHPLQVLHPTPQKQRDPPQRRPAASSPHQLPAHLPILIQRPQETLPCMAQR